jgi:uncharacterized protein YfiM (DUF2279 family)
VRHGINGYLSRLDSSEQFATWWAKIAGMEPAERKNIQENARSTAVEQFSTSVKLAAFLEALDAPDAAIFCKENAIRLQQRII